MVKRQLTSALIKEWAVTRDLDLVGVASAGELNAHPPDPEWPQTPARIWPGCRSLVALARRIPQGMFLAQDLTAKLATPHLVMNSLDNIALELSYFIEDSGYHAFPAPQQLTDLGMKRGTYGPLSLRHVAVEAGLGTLGLNMMLLTPSFGPRVYLSAVLTDAELEPDSRQEKRLCLGAACGRCLLACPPDAIGHWSLDKRRCSTHAQRFGASAFLTQLENLLSVKEDEARRQMVRSPQMVGLWQALRTGAGAYGGCPRCIEVCPVGEGYGVHLKERHNQIPEVTLEKERKQVDMRRQDKNGVAAPALVHSDRWVGKARNRAEKHI